jgi:alcohol dehydrogenase class IV
MKRAPAAVRPIAVGIWPKRMIIGTGSIDSLAALLRELQASRAVILCGKSVASSPLLARAESALGPLCCGIFDRVSAHTPRAMVEDALDMIRASRADAVVSIGGGSAIDAGKGVTLLGMAADALDAYVVRHGDGGVMEQPRLPRAAVVHVAIPTTYGSASEVMPTAGIRDPAARKKLLFWDDALIPDGVILDPQMTVYTPAELAAASGMTAVARCIESLYSVSRNPLAEGLALHALRLLYRNLPVAVESPGDLEARYECQVACSMSGIAAINSMVSVVHALGHIVGGTYGLQHGVSHAILLAPSMRALLPTIGDRQRLVLEAVGGDGAGLDPDDAGKVAADRIAALVRRLGLRPRLRDLGIVEGELHDLAAAASHDYMMVHVPRPIGVDEIENLLNQVW